MTWADIKKMWDFSGMLEIRKYTIQQCFCFCIESWKLWIKSIITPAESITDKLLPGGARQSVNKYCIHFLHNIYSVVLVFKRYPLPAVIVFPVFVLSSQLFSGKIVSSKYELFASQNTSSKFCTVLILWQLLEQNVLVILLACTPHNYLVLSIQCNQTYNNIVSRTDEIIVNVVDKFTQ